MKVNLHKAETRGLSNFGWLNSRHTYSFSKYYNKDRIGFGALRVINDDIVKPSMGFDMHAHDNMEIISIPLRGSLRHKDSIGNEHIIHSGEVQIMSAGTGIQHSEYNNSDSEDVNLLQIWVLPKLKDIEPRYEQKKFNVIERSNQIQRVVSPNGEEESLTINQDAYFSLTSLDKDQGLSFSLHDENNGVYMFIISGSIRIGNHQLNQRDGVEITETSIIEIQSILDTKLLIMEVPL